MVTDLRNATPDDIVRRLTDTPYATTAETALAGGLGAAQLGITAAVDEAIRAGLVRVVDTRDTTYGRNVRFLAIVTPTTPHPLVAKRAADWQELAERHGVKTTVKPMSESSYPDGLIISFETGFDYEYGHALIYPPREGGRRTRQALMIGEYSTLRDGSVRFGSRDLTRARFVIRLVEDWARRARNAAQRELVAA